MKVLMINGSTRSNSCTGKGLELIGDVFASEGIDFEIMSIGNTPIRDCTSCGSCFRNKNNRCVFDDDIVNLILKKAESADGFIFGTPVYYAHPSGQILSVLDRVFYAGSRVFYFKPGAAISCARRAGTIASIDVINKYFTISQMPIVSSTYWNEIHGAKPEHVLEDLEGVQTLTNLAKNMVWMLKCIDIAKNSGLAYPNTEKVARTNFIR